MIQLIKVKPTELLPPEDYNITPDYNDVTMFSRPGISYKITLDDVVGLVALRIDKETLGIDNIDNTADMDKPISTLTQDALDAKVDNDDISDHLADKTNPHEVTVTQLELENVDNTTDADKPVSTATGDALDLKATVTSVTAVANDLSDHESDKTNPHEVTVAQLNLENVNNTTDVNKPISSATQDALDLKATATSVTAVVNDLSDHENDKNNPHEVTVTQLELENVDNTTDMGKPVSTATGDALDLKADLVGGKVEASQLPDVVVIFVDAPTNLPTVGVGDAVYIVRSNNESYRWDTVTEAYVDLDVSPTPPDEVQNFQALANFPSTGEVGVVYISDDTAKTYTWSTVISGYKETGHEHLLFPLDTATSTIPGTYPTKTNESFTIADSTQVGDRFTVSVSKLPVGSGFSKAGMDRLMTSPLKWDFFTSSDVDHSVGSDFYVDKSNMPAAIVVYARVYDDTITTPGTIKVVSGTGEVLGITDFPILSDRIIVPVRIPITATTFTGNNMDCEVQVSGCEGALYVGEQDMVLVWSTEHVDSNATLPFTLIAPAGTSINGGGNTLEYMNTGNIDVHMTETGVFTVTPPLPLVPELGIHGLDVENTLRAETYARIGSNGKLLPQHVPDHTKEVLIYDNFSLLPPAVDEEVGIHIYLTRDTSEIWYINNSNAYEKLSVSTDEVFVGPTLPTSGETGVLYVNTTNNKTYTWEYFIGEFVQLDHEDLEREIFATNTIPTVQGVYPQDYQQFVSLDASTVGNFYSFPISNLVNDAGNPINTLHPNYVTSGSHTITTETVIATNISWPVDTNPKFLLFMIENYTGDPSVILREVPGGADAVLFSGDVVENQVTIDFTDPNNGGDKPIGGVMYELVVDCGGGESTYETIDVGSTEPNYQTRHTLSSPHGPNFELGVPTGSTINGGTNVLRYLEEQVINVYQITSTEFIATAPAIPQKHHVVNVENVGSLDAAADNTVIQTVSTGLYKDKAYFNNPDSAGLTEIGLIETKNVNQTVIENAAVYSMNGSHSTRNAKFSDELAVNGKVTVNIEEIGSVPTVVTGPISNSVGTDTMSGWNGASGVINPTVSFPEGSTPLFIEVKGYKDSSSYANVVTIHRKSDDYHVASYFWNPAMSGPNQGWDSFNVENICFSNNEYVLKGVDIKGGFRTLSPSSATAVTRTVFTPSRGAFFDIIAADGKTINGVSQQKRYWDISSINVYRSSLDNYTADPAEPEIVGNIFKTTTKAWFPAIGSDDVMYVAADTGIYSWDVASQDYVSIETRGLKNWGNDTSKLATNNEGVFHFDDDEFINLPAMASSGRARHQFYIDLDAEPTTTITVPTGVKLNGVVDGTLVVDTDQRVDVFFPNGNVGWVTSNVYIKPWDMPLSAATSAELDEKADLDEYGMVLVNQLPDVVVSTVFVANTSALPSTGVVDVIYINKDTNTSHRWDAATTAYVRLDEEVNLLKFADLAAFPTVGSANVNYIAKDTGMEYTWDTTATAYVTGDHEHTVYPINTPTSVGVGTYPISTLSEFNVASTAQVEDRFTVSVSKLVYGSALEATNNSLGTDSAVTLSNTTGVISGSFSFPAGSTPVKVYIKGGGNNAPGSDIVLYDDDNGNTEEARSRWMIGFSGPNAGRLTFDASTLSDDNNYHFEVEGVSGSYDSLSPTDNNAVIYLEYTVPVLLPFTLRTPTGTSINEGGDSLEYHSAGNIDVHMTAAGVFTATTPIPVAEVQPVSTAMQDALDLKADLVGGLIPIGQNTLPLEMTYTANTTWTFVHNKNCFPAVICMNTSGVLITPTVTYTDRDTVTITHSVAIAGTISIV